MFYAASSWIVCPHKGLQFEPYQFSLRNKEIECKITSREWKYDKTCLF